MNAKATINFSAIASPNLNQASPPAPCDLCGERFADQATFDAHQLTDEQRNPPSNKYLKGEPLRPKCLLASSLWARGWVRHRSPSKSAAERKVAAIWSKPSTVRGEPKVKARTGEEWICLLCKKAFASGVGFKAHYIHTFTKAERCLDSAELHSLHFELDTAQVWRMSIQTQHSASQIARLPSVRASLQILGSGELEAPIDDSYFNMRLDPTDNP